MPTTPKFAPETHRDRRSASDRARHARALALASTFALVTTLGGCGATSTHATKPVTPATVSPTAVAYLRALASNNPAATRAGLGYASPGSPAHRYLQYFALSADALAQAGRRSPPGVARPSSGGGVTVCDTPSCSDGAGHFSHFAFDSTGKLADFAIEGKPFASRLVVGGGATVRHGGARLTVLGSYQSGAGGDEHVIVGLRSGPRRLRVYAKRAIFREGGGIEDLTVFATGRSHPAPKGSGVILLAFPTAVTRGVLVLSACSGNPCSGRPWTAHLRVGSRG